MDNRYSALHITKPSNNTENGKRPYLQPHLLSFICYPLSIISPAHVPLPSGGAGRQALVGSAWHAPLPLLLQSPFAKAPALYLFLLALIVGLATFRHLRRVAAQMTGGNREQEIGNREQGTGIREQGTGNREQGIGSGERENIYYLLSIIYYLLSARQRLARLSRRLPRQRLPRSSFSPSSSSWTGRATGDSATGCGSRSSWRGSCSAASRTLAGS